jgi:uncharacterized membrane protein (UPF0127 family)
MNTQRKFVTWLLLWLAAVSLGVASADETNDAERLNKLFERSTLKIATPDARLHSFDVWLATDEQHRQLGLMFVRKMEPQAGMLFVYPEPFKIGMWMKDTFISLDMLFVNAKGKVVQVAERTTPESLKTISSNSAVIGVIELNAGTAERLRIRTGSQVMHAAFGTAPK